MFELLIKGTVSAFYTQEVKDQTTKKVTGSFQKIQFLTVDENGKMKLIEVKDGDSIVKNIEVGKEIVIPIKIVSVNNNIYYSINTDSYKSKQTKNDK